MPVQRRDLHRLLLALGFIEVSSRHIQFHLVVNGVRVASTMVSRGENARTLGEAMVSTIAKDIGVSRAFLYQLVRGEKGRDDYYTELRRQGLID